MHSQDNDIERSAQVQLMRAIYAQANRVLVYLGDDGFYDIDLALALLEQKDYTEIFLQRRRQLSRPMHRQPNDIDHRSDAALSRLLARLYFQRLWVVQELSRHKRSMFIAVAEPHHGY